jgi:hypothetical protein
LTYSGSTINWNPALGLNAAITLTQNSTLSFTAAPPVGSYGTVVLTQDGTGGRTLTLPTLQGATNQVLGSTSTSTVALSTAASSKDILNFYYDGTVVYWNIGQGYGAAASSGTTNLGTGVTGTLGVASGGTGATTLTGLVKGNGTGAMTAAVAGTDYLAPTGSAAGLTNFPTLNQNTTGNAATATLATSATSATSAATAGNITATSNTTLTSLANLTTVGTITSGTWSGTAIAVANGGTGATNAADARTNLGLVIGTNVQAPLVAGTDYLAPTGSAAGLTNFPTLNQNTTGNAANVTGTVAVANGGTGAATLTGYVKGTGTTAMTASATIPVADVTGAAPLASPTFTGAVTAPIYATTPQALTFGSPISWNPANGLNASVTLTGNGTLSFSSPPTAGAYGTLVVTQDGAGSRTLTLPTATNKVLGSAATTAIALSTAANAIDIVNFYYDGSNYFWNVGQGYGSAASITASNIAGGAAGSIPYQTASGATSLLAKGTDGQILTLASGLPSWAAAPVTGVTSASSPLSISSNAISLGTVPVSSGGTGATTLASNNVLLGNGTSALQVVAPGNSGNVLTSNGTTWSSTAPAALGVPYSGATGAVNLGSYELTANGVAVGRGASSKSNNYAYGYAVLSANTTGNYNNAFGHQALTANTTGLDNNAFGEYVLPKNIGGNYNTAMGSNALKENTSGSGNTAFGRQALQTNSTGSNNTALGHQANVSVDGLSNATAIGNGATVTASNTIQLGNSAVTNLKTNGTITAKDVTYPNTHNSTAGQVLTVNATGTASWAAPSGGSSSGGHYVGEVYGGGIVFYVTPGGYHGLIASSTDIMTSPILAIDRATSPDYHGYTTNNENLYTDWRAPTFSQLKLLREARNTAGLNLNLSSNVSYISSTTSSNDTFAFTCLRFVDNYIEYPNGNWTNDGRLVLRSIRTF